MTEVTTIHELETEDKETYITIEVEVSWSWVDNSIGSYEFWGTPGIHTQYDLEMSDYYINSFTIEDESTVGHYENTKESKEKYPDVWKMIEEKTESLVENIDPPENEYADSDDNYDEVEWLD